VNVLGRRVDADLVRAVSAVLAVALLLLGVLAVSVTALALGALAGLVALTLFLVRAEDRRHSGRGSA
jgi:hypothetical protein